MSTRSVLIRVLQSLLLGGLALLSLNAGAEPQLGKEYALVSPPQATETGKKIEVLEIFSYRCPHCFELEPMIAPWAKKLPKNVVFRRMPAAFNDSWVPLAKAYYAAEAIGVTEKIHAKIFDAVHVQGINLNDENTLFDWVEKQGVDRKKFADAYRSFGVQSQVTRNRQQVTAYGVEGVPSVIVNGKYRTSSSMTGGHEGLLQTLNLLIKRAESEKAGHG